MTDPTTRYTFYKNGQSNGKHNTASPADLSHYVFGKAQPAAVQLEEAVLGALMIDREAFPVIAETLYPEAFYLETHQHIFRAIAWLYENQLPVDLLTVTEQMKKAGTLEKAGGGYYLVELSHRVASAANIEYHARIIEQKHIQRQMIEAGAAMVRDAYEETADVFEVLDKSQGAVMRIGEMRTIEKSIEQVAAECLKETEAAAQIVTGLVGVPTGMTAIDRVTGGWRKTDFVILAARPAMGKTGLALSMALNAGRDFKKPIGFFSLEMSAKQLVNRLLSAHSEIDGRKIRNPKEMTEADWQRYQTGLGVVMELPIFIDDTAGASIMHIRQKARTWKRRHNIEAIYIDYVQLITGGEGGNREQQLADISRKLKGLAKDLDIPVIALCQLSRAVETRGGSKRPQLSDLRETGSFENDADIVAFIYRPEYYRILEDENGRSLKGVAELIFAKHRHGALANPYIAFEETFTRFADLPPGSALLDYDAAENFAFKDINLLRNVDFSEARKEPDDIPF